MKLRELTSFLDSEVPVRLQEPYDNAGLQVGNPDQEAASGLIALDVTEDVLSEAIAGGFDIIISHHPLIFGGLKRVTGSSATEKIVAAAIKNDIAVYSAHTNLDVFRYGVSRKMAEKFRLVNIRPLAPLKDRLLKLVTFVPESHADKVREAVFGAGAGVIGNYDCCGYSVSGTGSFRGGDDTNPFVGVKGKIHSEKEIRFETILFSHLRNSVVKALLGAHPYEEVAYDIYPLQNETTEEGLGCTGELTEPVPEAGFLDLAATIFGQGIIRYSHPTGRIISKVALCGGSGSSLLADAIAKGADAFITADIKYHAFREAEKRILLIDAGHFETEKFAAEILYDLIIKKFPNFALRFSDTNNNAVNYL